MKLTIHIPDDLIDGYGISLPPPELGFFEAIAVDAILAALQRMADIAATTGAPDV